MSDISTDVAIIGAGPIGLELAVALKREGIDYLHFDEKQIGYTISWFAPQTKFFSSNERIAIAGVPLQTADQSKASREEYLTYLRQIVMQFDLKIRTYESVTNIQKIADGFRLTTRTQNADNSYTARKIVLAVGGTAWPRRLNVPGEDLPHVSHYFRDPHEYFQKRLLVVGGKNSAVEAILRSHHAGANVAISYRGEKLSAESIKYWLMPEMSTLLDSGRITGHFQTTVESITPTRVKLKRSNGETFDVDADFVLALIGYDADTHLFKLAGVKLNPPQDAPIFNEQTMETNVEGIFVAGTAAAGTQSKYRLFIENCHIHVDRIVAALTHRPPPPAPKPNARLES